ncbi:MAG: sigma-70 family RNA polymerase sigma factor [Bacillota bacterium]
MKALVTQAQSGDMQAFEQLVLLYQDRLYGLCHRLAGNHADAQDLAQEAFVRAYRALGKFRQEADFGTYLHRIAVNLWLSYRKRNHNEFSLDDPVLTTEGELPRQVADNNQHPEQVLENAEFQLLVREALAVLPKEHRAVLVLREMESLSYEEIAATLGVAPGTVKSRLNRARNALKKALHRTAAKKGFELPVTDR